MCLDIAKERKREIESFGFNLLRAFSREITDPFLRNALPDTFSRVSFSFNLDSKLFSELFVVAVVINCTLTSGHRSISLTLSFSSGLINVAQII